MHTPSAIACAPTASAGASGPSAPETVCKPLASVAADTLCASSVGALPAHAATAVLLEGEIFSESPASVAGDELSRDAIALSGSLHRCPLINILLVGIDLARMS